MEELVRNIRLNNPGRTIPASKTRGFADMIAADDWLREHWSSVPAAVHFDLEKLPSISVPEGPPDLKSEPAKLSIGYVLQTNSTVKFFKGEFEHPNLYVQLPLQVAVERVCLCNFLLIDTDERRKYARDTLARLV